MRLQVRGVEGSDGVDEEEEPAAVPAVRRAGHPAEPLNPEAEGALVVGLERVDAEDFEAGGLGSFKIAGERFGRDLCIEGLALRSARPGRTSETVDEKESAGNEHGAHACQVVGEICGGNMLEDGEVGDFVEGFRPVGLGAQVTAFDEGSAFESSLRDAFANDGQLSFAGRYAVDVGASVAGRAEEKRAPSTGNVEEAVAAFDPQGRECVLDSGLLCGVEIVLGAGEEGAGMGEGRAEPWLEERNGESDGAGRVPPVHEGRVFPARLEAAGDVDADAADGLEEIAAEAFGLAEGVGGYGEEGGEISLNVEIAIEEDLGESGFRRVADNRVQAVAGGKGSDECRLMERGRGPGPAISGADAEGRAVILAEELVELLSAQDVAGALGKREGGAAGHHEFAWQQKPPLRIPGKARRRSSPGQAKQQAEDR